MLSGGGFSIAIEGFSIVPVLDRQTALSALGAERFSACWGLAASLRGARLPIVVAMREVD
jgi:hypothetical protein